MKFLICLIVILSLVEFSIQQCNWKNCHKELSNCEIIDQDSNLDKKRCINKGNALIYEVNELRIISNTLMTYRCCPFTKEQIKNKFLVCVSQISIGDDIYIQPDGNNQIELYTNNQCNHFIKWT